MKQLSAELLSSIVLSKRKEKNLTQIDVSRLTGINRTLLSKLENCEFTPSVNQLLALASVLYFDILAVLVDANTEL